MFLAQRTYLQLESLDDRIVPAVVDLSAFGSYSFLANGTVVHRNDAGWTDTYGADSAASGNINSFLTVSGKGNNPVEQGFNTDSRPIQFNEKSEPLKTHSIQLGNVPLVTVNGVQYREFVLDVNQKTGSPNLSVDEARIFLGSVGNLTNYNTETQTLAGQSAVWDLDAGEDSTILVKSLRIQGGHASEMVLLVPESAFAGATNESFVYLYSKMGATAGAGANAGVEQWGYRQSPPVSPPPPPPAGTASLSGNVSLDPDQTPGGDTPLEMVRIALLDTNFNEVAFTFTDNFGNYQFDNLDAGTYTIYEDLDELAQDPKMSDGANYIGTVGGLTNGTIVPADADLIQGIVLADGAAGIGYNFTEVLSAS